jgi:hypothetical protein
MSHTEGLKIANGGLATKSVQPFEFMHGDKRYSIVDTPGFNDTDRSDNDVLKDLADWLLESMQRGKKISGIIYLHRISDTKMEGSAVRNLRMFRKLCGKDFMKNVVLGTTFWDKVGEEQGADREKELLETDDFFKEMKSQGCHVVRISGERNEDLALLDRFAGQPPMVMQIQRELFGGKMLEETAAASAVNQELAEIQRQNLVMLRDVEHQVKDKMHRSALEKVLGMHIQRKAFEETMEELGSKQDEVRKEIEKQERKDEARMEFLKAEKLKQERGFQIQITELNEQLQALKAKLP